MSRFNDFFSTWQGALVVAAVGAFLFVLFAADLKGRRCLSAKNLSYSAISMAIALVLSSIKLFEMPQGGSVTAFSMIFISVIGYFFGLRPGILAALTYGLLQLVLDPFVVHPVQLLMDYPLAFGALGLSGIFGGSKNGLTKGYILGALTRCLISTVSGMVFFAEYAGDSSVLVYSLSYNLSYIVPEMIVTLIVINMPAFKTALNQVKARARTA